MPTAGPRTIKLKALGLKCSLGSRAGGLLDIQRWWYESVLSTPRSTGMENPADGKICRVIRTDVGRLTGAACAVIVRVEHLPPSDVSLSERTDLRNSVCKAVRSRTAPGRDQSSTTGRFRPKADAPSNLPPYQIRRFTLPRVSQPEIRGDSLPGKGTQSPAASRPRSGR